MSAIGRFVVAAVVATAFAQSAIAQPTKQPAPSVSCEFIEISASSSSAATVDAELEKLKKKFRKPPFSSWNTFKMLMKVDQSLTKGKTESIKLKIGSATATLVEIVDKSKVRLTITIDDGKGKQLVNSKSTVEGGDYLVYGHSLPNNDGHLLALTCK